MNITEIHIAQLTIPLLRPFITAVRRTDCVDDVVVMIKTACGRMGYGSAASTPAITGDDTDSIISAITKLLGPQLIGRSVSEINSLLDMNERSPIKNTSAKAAIDIALHDLGAQSCDLPLYKWLGGTRNSIDSCITISVKAIDEMVHDAIDLVSQGHQTIKIKLGLDPLEDIERVQAIRTVTAKIQVFIIIRIPVIQIRSHFERGKADLIPLYFLFFCSMNRVCRVIIQSAVIN